MKLLESYFGDTAKSGLIYSLIHCRMLYMPPQEYLHQKQNLLNYELDFVR